MNYENYIATVSDHLRKPSAKMSTLQLGAYGGVKKLLTILIFFLFYSCTQKSEHEPIFHARIVKEVDANVNEELFKFFANNHFGFINSEGKVVIEAKFNDVLNFTEGLASARVSAKFGYIDYTGEFVIQPKYDFAGYFIEGLAIVYIKGSPAIIDISGEYIVKPHIFQTIDKYSDGIALVTSKGNLYGAINRDGKLVIDTIYRDITRFNSGRAIVTGVNHPNDIRMKEQEKGVIDRKGNMIVKYGQYFDVYQYNDGYAKVEVFNEKYDENYGWSSYEGLIDTNGILMFKTIDNLENVFQNGLIKANIGYNKDIFYNLNGEATLNNLPLIHLGNYSEGYTVNWDMKRYQIYNKNGKLLLPNTFNHADLNGFKNGMMEVEYEEGKWGLIDTTGKFLVECKYNGIHSAGLANNRVFYREMIGDTYQYIWGLLNEKGDTIVPAKFTKVENRGFESDIVYVEQDSLYGYINKDGKYVWKNILDYENQNTIFNLNSSVMLRAYCYVMSSVEDTVGDKYEWVNYPKKITKEVPRKKLGLMVDTTSKSVFAKQYNGYYVYLFNTTGDTVEIEVQDGRLGMVMQVKDEGEWKDVEYMPNSWCGNSYYDVCLLDGENWEIAIPIYDGEKEVEARLRLMIADKYKDGVKLPETFIYSNSFKVKVNPGQFWNKGEYSPHGIMNPYFD